ncbi:MAG TPA: hypothetical protein VES67_06190 [Vicinamibacterales bacterium]|nr:hypothetical protein [Vicinamibacterales bacterium]
MACSRGLIMAPLAAGFLAVGAFASARQGGDTIRVSGQVLVEGGGPIAGASLRTDALRGAMSAPFGGQREFTARSNESGDWSLLGITRGLWILEVSAPQYLPHVLVVPISMMLKPEPGPWETSLALLPVAAIAPPDMPKDAPERFILQAIDQLQSDKKAARQTLQKLTGASLNAGGLVAAGDIALLLREPGMARRFFELAATAEPKWYRPQLGVASAAMMSNDIDRAMKAYAAARDNTNNKKLEVMLSNTIKDLQQIRGRDLELAR